jgi:hypothetical protein
MMENLHRKLYTTLAGRVDTAIGELEDMINRRAFDWVRAIRVKELLQAALLEAEELYVSAGEDLPPKLIVLDQKDRP